MSPPALKAQLTSIVRRNRIEECKDYLNTTEPSVIYNEIKERHLLHEAVLNDSTGCLELLLPHVTDDLLLLNNLNGKSVFTAAIESQRLKCITILVEHKPTLLIKNDGTGHSAFHFMVRQNYIAGCEEALKYMRSTEINSRNTKGESAVHLAAKENHHQMLKLLLSKGGDPAAKTSQRYTPLHFAADNGYNRCVEILVNHKKDNNLVEYLNIQPNSGQSALIIAAIKGFRKCCELLEGTDPNLKDKNGWTALHHAAVKGYVSVAELLIENFNANPCIANNKKKTALFYAASCPNSDCLTYLLEKSNLNESAVNLAEMLHKATQKNCFENMQTLLSIQNARQYINEVNSNKDTLLHVSIRKGYFNITSLLLEHNADKNISNNYGNYPLHLAAAQRHQEPKVSNEENQDVCRLILRNSHEIVNEPNAKNETPLILAARSGNTDMIRSFLRKGAKVFDRDERELNSVHIAAREGHDTSLKVLLKHLTATQKQELEKEHPHPLHIAAEHGHLECCKIIVGELRVRF